MSGLERDMLRNFFVIGLVFMLTGCASSVGNFPMNQYRLGASMYKAKHYDDEGFVVLGVKTTKSENINFRIYRFDEATGNSYYHYDTIYGKEGDGSWGWGQDCAGAGSFACKGDTAYFVFALPQGVYGFGAFYNSGYAKVFTNYEKSYISKDVRSESINGVSIQNPSIRADTPIWKVSKGEYIYIGDVVIDPNPQLTLITYKQNIENAQAVLAETGVTTPLTLRPWTIKAKSQ